MTVHSLAKKLMVHWRYEIESANCQHVLEEDADYEMVKDEQCIHNDCAWYDTTGFSRFIYTDINRDCMKLSPNFEETSKIAKISNCPVIISGGVSSIADIRKAKTLENIEGIIVGKAIYDEDISLSELVLEL